MVSWVLGRDQVAPLANLTLKREIHSHFFPLFQTSSAAESEARTPFGLVKGHAYSVTGIEEVRPVVRGKETPGEKIRECPLSLR